MGPILLPSSVINRCIIRRRSVSVRVFGSQARLLLHHRRERPLAHPSRSEGCEGLDFFFVDIRINSGCHPFYGETDLDTASVSHQRIDKSGFKVSEVVDRSFEQKSGNMGGIQIFSLTAREG